LDESNKKVLVKILKEDENKLETKYQILKETVVDKLEDLKEKENDSDVINTISETIKKLETENFDRINYFKLFELNKSI
jgi:lipoate-protein ligase A